MPAAALIPVTHRGSSDRVTIANGHGVPDDPEALASLARGGGTLVLFMGLERLPELAAGLVAAGLDPATPGAVVANGTLPEQESVTGRLDELAELAAGLPTPALVVVGEVVGVARRLRAAVERQHAAVG